jgi:hypothetical protein
MTGRIPVIHDLVLNQHSPLGAGDVLLAPPGPGLFINHLYTAPLPVIPHGVQTNIVGATTAVKNTLLDSTWDGETFVVGAQDAGRWLVFLNANLLAEEDEMNGIAVNGNLIAAARLGVGSWGAIAHVCSFYDLAVGDLVTFRVWHRTYDLSSGSQPPPGAVPIDREMNSAKIYLGRV